MDDDSLDRLLAGDLNKLPLLPKRVVRLFISSTFTDMTLERNSLMERVYPRLKKYCRERHGLDFQVVDMRWGVRDEATDDHQTVNLCSREIDNCQRVSLGPNFVALIGDKYGFRPLLNCIKSSEYRSLRRCLIESDINTDFLDTWYKEDLNAVPPEYLLQPISSILKNFTNKSEPELQMVDQKIWQAIQERLHDLLLIGSERLVRQGRMSEHERTLKYSISVTEREVLEGCFELNASAKSHCLVYVRTIVDLRNQLSRYFEELARLKSEEESASQLQHHQQLEAPGRGGGGSGGGSNGGTSTGNVHVKVAASTGKVSSASASAWSSKRRNSSSARKASLKIGEDSISLTTSGAQTSAERKLERQRRLISKYIDLTSRNGGAWQVDEDAQKALRQFKEVKLRDKLGETRRNLTIYEIHWNDQDGISAKSEEHKEYLNNLTEHFYQNLTRMIRSAVKSERKVKTSGLVGEVLQHSHYSLRMGESVHGRSRELEQIRAYIQTGCCQVGASTSFGPTSRRRGTTSSVVLPMFVYGVSGSGKTSVLARVATLAGAWIKQAATSSRRRFSTSSSVVAVPSSNGGTGSDEGPTRDRWDRAPCIIVRFGCTTPASSSMVGMLTSVCRQLQYNFYQFGPLNGFLDKQEQRQPQQQQQQPDSKSSGRRGEHSDQLAYQRIPEDFVRLVHTFRQLLDNCRHSLHKRRTFLIIIDSVERLLSPAECNLEAKYSWLTSLARLPQNVRLIVSCGSSSLVAGNPSNSSSPSSLNSSSANNDDYLHLKRHFLRAYYKLHESRVATSEGLEMSTRRRDSPASSLVSSDLDRDGELMLMTPISETESNELLSSEIGSITQERLHSAQSSSSQQPAAHARYQMLKRLILPVARLARGSKSFTFEEGQAMANAVGASPSRSMTHTRFDRAETPSGSRQSELNGTTMRRAPSAITRETSILSTSYSDAESSKDNHRARESSRDDQDSVPGAGLLHIRPLGAHLAQAVLRHWLAESGRNLSQQQWALVQKSFAKCSRPIFIKLAFGEVINWKSYSMQGDTKGLTFGSAWLGDFSLGDAAADHQKTSLSLCPELERMCCRGASWDGGDQEKARFKWQMLSMEQQWLNYLDYRSRAADAQATGQGQLKQGQGVGGGGGGGGSGTEGNLVIRIGANSSGPTGSALVANNQKGSTTGGTGVGGASAPSSLSICHLSDTIEDAICQLFARIELQHGYLLTKHSLSYITAARNGICENELEDILSLDDVVLDDVFQYHLPPVRRIPPLLWTRIRNDLPDYLSERDADGIVVAWHHNQFKSVTEKRYLADDSQLVYIHSLMADYFMGKWADKPKPFRCTKQQVEMAAEQLESAIQQSMRRDSDQTRGRSSGGGGGGGGGGSGRLGSGSAPGRSGTSFSARHRLRSSDQHDQRLQWMQAKALRRVPQQPLFYESQTSTSAAMPDTAGSTGVAAKADTKDKQEGEQQLSGATIKRRYNLRKLTEMPHHLLRSGRFLDLARLVLFNYRWLFATIDALGLQSLFCDLDEARHQLELELTRRRSTAKLKDANSNGGGVAACDEQEDDEDRDDEDQFVGAGQGERVSILEQAAAEFTVAARDNLTSAALKSLIQQVATLSDTLRLSSSVIHSQPQMLAPQLIGRLQPAARDQLQQAGVKLELSETTMQRGNSTAGQARQRQSYKSSSERQTQEDFLFLWRLIEQCYKDGASDCALLPLAHCLCTSDGLKLSSLEGHPFGVTALALASDQRHLLAVSSKFIMWNISTGEIARDIEPRLSGSVIMGLVMSTNNQFALAYSSDQIVLALEILSQQVIKLDLKLSAQIEASDQLVGLELIDRHQARRFFVWTQSGRLIVMRLSDKEEDAVVVSRTGAGGSLTGGAVHPASDDQQSNCEVSIVIEYQIDQPLGLFDLLGSKECARELLEVSVVELERNSSDLIFLTTTAERQEQQGSQANVRFETFKVNLSSTGQMIERIEVWPNELASCELRSVALSRPLMSQLVTADTQGNISLYRRRANKWSRPKTILRSAGINRNEIAPLDIELEQPTRISMHADDDDDHGISCMLRRGLADFEAKLDGHCDEIKGLSGSVYGSNHSDHSNANTGPESGRLSSSHHSDRTNFIKLYWPSCIVVLRLDCKVATDDDNSSSSSSSSSSYQKKCLLLPRDIRNVSLRPSQSQMISKITVHETDGERGHYLMACANRKLLIYSLESEQLLKCFDAHSKRITSLLTISTSGVQRRNQTSDQTSGATTGQDEDSFQTSSWSAQQLGNALATCSLDRTVNIWNLQNMNKEERQLDRLVSSTRSASGNLQFDTIKVSSQQPLVAALARNQLSFWNWLESKLVLTIDSTDDLPAVEHTQTHVTSKVKIQGQPFSKCKFSSSGRYLAVASLAPTVHLLTCDGFHESRAKTEPSSSTTTDTRPIHLRHLALSHLEIGEISVRSLKFFAQDSRLIVVADSVNLAAADNADETKRDSAPASRSEQDDDDTLTDATSEEMREPELYDRLSVFCLTIPEMRRVYSFECLVPKAHTESAAVREQYMSGQHASGSRQRNTEMLKLRATTGHKRQRAICLTCDEQFLVVAEVKSDDQHHLGQLDVGRLRRRSSAVHRLHVALNLYSARDGKFVSSIDLSRLQAIEQRTSQQQVRVSDSVSLEREPQAQSAGRDFLASGLQQVQAFERKATAHQVQTARQISISGDQFNRLKAIKNRERQSIVALIDDERGISFQLDINKRLVLAQSNIWSGGQLSSDGRFGLSRIYSSGGGGAGPLVGVSGKSSSRLAGGGGGGGDTFSSGGGLKLLEMRQCRAVKSLLTLDQLATLTSGGVRSTAGAGTAASSGFEAAVVDRAAATGDSDTICGFTRPNDAYVYLCDLRQRRLLLMRVRDSQLIANYKLATPISHIKCSSDGLALILGQTDGSLVSLAIVDPQSSDSQDHLSSHLGSHLNWRSTKHSTPALGLSSTAAGSAP